MNLFDLPLELIDQIFSAAVEERAFKRVMRLRLVNRQFRYFTDEAIFSSRMLDDIAFGDELDIPIEQHDSPWVSYLRTYLGRRIYQERNEKTMLGQYRQVAEYLWATGSKLLPDLTFENSVYDLSSTALFLNSSLETSVLLKSSSSKETFGQPELATLFLNALVYTGLEPFAKALVSEDPKDYWQCPTVAASTKPCLRRLIEMAAFRGHLDMVQHLVQVEKKTTRNNWAFMSASTASTIIRFASIGGYPDVIDYALENSNLVSGRPTTATRRNIAIALSFAKSPEIYRKLSTVLESVFDTIIQDDVYACLDQAARQGNTEMVRSLLLGQDVCLNQPGADANPTKTQPPLEEQQGCDSSSSTPRPLISAIESGNLETVEVLLRHGADPNWFPATRTALMAAVHKGDITIVRKLVEYGAKVHVGTPPPLVVAVQQENEDIFNYLLASSLGEDAGAGADAGAWAMAYPKFFDLDSMADLLCEKGIGRRDETLHHIPTCEENEYGRYLFRRKHYGSEALEPYCKSLC
ncbi:ankyrin [Poronia punctata]|nr:ankyrin [Poronia punctata]